MSASIEKNAQLILEKLKKNLPSFEVRDAQQRLINGILHVTKNTNDVTVPNHLIVEAPTGSGKSLGALIPAISYLLNMRENKHDDIKLIYSTATVTLQQQLEKDIQLLQKMGIKFKSHTAVGRGRFFCKNHADQLIETVQIPQASLGLDEPMEVFDPLIKRFDLSSEEKNSIKKAKQLLTTKKWSGMKDDLDESLKINNSVWKKVQSDANTCSSKCQYWKDCPFIDSRQAMKKADLILTNHSMLLADFEQTSAPWDLEKSIVVLDEGHRVFDIFAEQQSASANLKTLSIMMSKNAPLITNSITTLYNKAGITCPLSVDKITKTFLQCQRELSFFSSQLDSCFSHVSEHYNKWEKERGIWELSIQELHQYSLYLPLKNIKKDINAICDLISGALEANKGAETNDEDHLALALCEQLSVCENARDTLHYFLQAEEYYPIALWFQKCGTGASSFTMHAAQIDMSELMKEKFWNQVKHCILMSATLTNGGKFDRLCKKLGVTKKMAYAVALKTPFSQAYENSKLHLYPHFADVDWRNETPHSLQIVSEMEIFMRHHTAGLLLVNSKRQLKEIVSLLPQSLRDIALVQSENVSRNVLINRHKARIDKGGNSILIGMTSFSEGLDLAGHYLTCVGIAKLQFGQSNSPRANTESKYITKNGGNPFEELILPETEQNLKQSVGRLIRSMSCTGEVAIFDKRLCTKKYGHTLQNALPNFQRIYHDPKSIAC